MANVKAIIESICQSGKALGLVSLMQPVELMKTLIKDMDLLPKEAAKVVYDLRKHAEGISHPGIESNKEFPVPPSHRKDPDAEEQEESTALARPQGKVSSHGPNPIQRHHFPPDPIAEPDDYPYDDTFVNYMNNPKRKLKMRDAKIKTKNPLDVDLRTQPGGDGAGGGGMHRRSFHSRDNDQPGSGTSWSKQGRPGWSSSPTGKEFELPQNHAKSKKTEDGERKAYPNAGDDDDEPSFMKDPNVGQTIWDPKTGKSGTSNYRKMPWRGYSKK